MENGITRNKIGREVDEFKDIILLNELDGSSFIDTYNNLANKLKLFHYWVKSVKTEYVMKTDEDSFVDILQILKVKFEIKLL